MEVEYDPGELLLKLLDETNNDYESNSDSNTIGQHRSTNESENKIEVNKGVSVSAELDHSTGLEVERQTSGVKETERSGSKVVDKNTWYIVGLIKGNGCNINNYYLLNNDVSDITVNNLPDLSKCEKFNLEPGAVYKVRLAAVNYVGISNWRDVSAFKTCCPGSLVSPTVFRIFKLADAIRLSWNRPSNNRGDILEYSVYLAVKDKARNHAGQINFLRIYCGPNNTCAVPNTILATANMDTTAKGAIIFRVVARNYKGYGPATEVRWIQGSRTTSKATTHLSEGQGSLAKK